MVCDLVQIKRLGESKRAENERLRKHLKRHSFADRRIRRIAEDVEDSVDCKTCANCCKVATVRLVDRDIAKLAKSLRVSPVVFARDYTEVTDEGTILRRTDAGCVFLDGNTCLVYDDRPGNCQDFPHTVRGGGSFLARMWDFPDRACYCPIVYDTLEAIKKEVEFRG